MKKLKKKTKAIIAATVVVAATVIGIKSFANPPTVPCGLCITQQDYFVTGLKRLFDERQLFNFSPLITYIGYIGHVPLEDQIYVTGNGQSYHLELTKSMVQYQGFAIPSFTHTHVTFTDMRDQKQVINARYSNAILSTLVKQGPIQGPVWEQGPTTSPIAERQPPHIPRGGGIHRSSRQGINSY